MPYSVFSDKYLIIIVANSERVAVPLEARLALVLPVISPSALAHSIALSAQLLMLSASV